MPELRRCIRSLIANTPADDYRIFYIDNGSEVSDIAALITDYPNVSYVHLPMSVGFVRAMNIGMTLSLMSPAPYMLWLNNDTEIRKGDNEWLARLLAPFEDGPEIAAVGPISNNVFGVQRRETPLPEGDWIDVPILIGFATLLKKDVVRQIGFLDERFSPGNYEDWDYCLRLRQAGYKLIVNEQVWLDHKMHVSWKKVDDFNEILNRNLHKLIDKWGVGNMRLLGISVEGEEKAEDTTLLPDSVKSILPSVRLVTHATPNWIENVTPYLESLNSNSPFENWLLVVNGNKDVPYSMLPKVNHAVVPQTPGAPEVTHSLQHGSFLPYVPGPDEDVLIYTDGDIVMQRAPSASEYQMVSELPDNAVMVGYNSSPHETLALEASRLMPRIPDIATVFNPSILSNSKCYNIGVIIAKRSTWRRIHEKYMELYPLAYQVFARQQRQQWLVCYVIALLNIRVQVLPYSFHMHGCFALPPGGSVNGTANYNGEPVLFRHHL